MSHVVRYCNRETGGVLPGCLKGAANEKPTAFKEFFVGLTSEKGGLDKDWVLLDCPAGYMYGATAASKGKGKKKK